MPGPFSWQGDKRHSGFLRCTLLGKMDKVSTHREVIWFWLIVDKSHLISELCSILKLFYGEKQWDIIQSKQSCRQVENAVVTSQGMAHLSSKEQLQNDSENLEDSDIAS